MYTVRATNRRYRMLCGQMPPKPRRSSSASAPGQHWPSTATPSPHEILRIERGIPYTKRNFNKLVKLYHPDLASASAETKLLPKAILLERYRLLIAAHALLSDPYKRQRYEANNEGWIFQDRSPTSWRSRGSQQKTCSRAHSYQDTSPNPMRQQPIYTSNAVFAILVVALSMFGAVLQLKRFRRARSEGKKLDLLSQSIITGEMQGLAVVLHGQSRDDRIVAFLARRHLISQHT